MTPSIELRLQSVLHGLRDVVMPAINPSEALAGRAIRPHPRAASDVAAAATYADRYYCQPPEPARARLVQGRRLRSPIRATCPTLLRCARLTRVKRINTCQK
jgi:hypothetical protein